MVIERFSYTTIWFCSYIIPNLIAKHCTVL